MDKYSYTIIHVICLAGNLSCHKPFLMLSNSCQPCSLGKAAGRDLAVAQGPRPGAAAANRLLTLPGCDHRPGYPIIPGHRASLLINLKSI